MGDADEKLQDSVGDVKLDGSGISAFVKRAGNANTDLGTLRPTS
jgi:hypothetical protein